VPFLAYVHSHEPDPPTGNGGGPRPWEPNWRMWRWIAATVVAVYCATQTEGAARALLVIVAFVLVCLAVDEGVPRGDGLREWRQ
jgi:hypothetical protein